MKSFLILCLFYFTGTFNCLQLFAQQTNSPTKTIEGNTYAVIVGITNYKDPAIPALQFADKDAQQFSAFLQSKGGGLVPKNHIRLIVNKEATIAAIYDALDWLKEQCHKNDVAYIYFSGHGDVETKNNFSKGFLLAYNSPQNNYANNAIRVEDLNSTSIVLTTKNKAKVILISDACHSGKLAGDFYKGKQLAAGQLNLVLNNQVRLASCAENEEAAEGPEWGGGRGVFSYYLVMGLQGLADLRNSGTIQLKDLTKYLDSSFDNDTYLIQNKHIQNPVTDGNPGYPLANIDAATINSVKETIKKNNLGGSDLPPGLMDLEPLQPQPVDYFFSAISSMPLESMLDFESYKTLNASALPLKMVNDCIAYQDTILKEMASSTKEEFAKKNYTFFKSDSLNLLKNELLENKLNNSLFVEKFVQSVHDKGQDMISAYLNGDMAELERRQYYYSGKRDYRNFLSMLQIALNVVPQSHKLSHILQVNNFYITGLIDRMQMAISPNIDSLLTLAFYNQQQALKMEPYAAYILNELGNLYLYKNNYDSAKYNFDLASVISPKWAIPWSNKIRLNMVFNKFHEGEMDFRTADSLQPNLAFVFTSAGMMMERKKNILAAESYYLRTIKINNVHFLPFERLGYIYLNTGDYKKANYYLYQAQMRKKDFSINDVAFAEGPVSDILFPEYYPDSAKCVQLLVAKNETSRQYIKLLNCLKNLDSSGTGIKSLEELLMQKPDIPFANHYAGKIYYHLGKWQLAKKALERSASNYLSNNQLLKKLAKDIFGKPLSSRDSCQLNPFLDYQYDELEDHYLLASLYEKEGENEKAFSQYNSISSIENARQSAQAIYADYLKEINHLNKGQRSNLLKKTEEFILMGGAIKAVRLHEKLGQFQQAEQVLLRQVSLSRAAGNARMEAVKKIDWKLIEYGNQDYWLSVNSYLESETYNFYKIVLNVFPRDPTWQEKAGLFLYNRLESAFTKVPVDEVEQFYNSIGNHPYPWKSRNQQNDNYYAVIIGTGENLSISTTKFDPVREALNAIDLSVRLSGDIQPHIKAAKALADLYSWIGNENQSILWFYKSQSLNPADVEQRNKFITYLNYVDLLPDACNQLDTLYRQKKTTSDQTIQLAKWKYLSGENKEAMAIVNKFVPVGQEQKCVLLLISAKASLLSGDTISALQTLLDHATISKIDSADYGQVQLDKKTRNSYRLYTIARIYAFLNKADRAFYFLKMALDSGFDQQYVISYDKAWSGLHGSKNWNDLIKNPPSPLIEPNNYEINPLTYATPDNLK
ncbi:MAG: caspase family protein [Ginsengibacter sp.]